MELCVEAGLVEGTELYLDATNVDANASVHGIQARLSLVAAHEHVQQVFADNPLVSDGCVEPEGEPHKSPLAQEGAPGPTDGDEGEDSKPVASPPGGFVSMVETYHHPHSSELRKRQRPRISDFRYSPTDPDACLMRSSANLQTRLGYHDHYIVDGGKARIILGALVTPSSIMENTPMLDLVRRARFRWGLRPRQASLRRTGYR